MQVIENVDKRLLAKAVYIRTKGDGGKLGTRLTVEQALGMVATDAFTVWKVQRGYVNIGTARVRTTSEYTIELWPKA